MTSKLRRIKPAHIGITIGAVAALVGGIILAWPHLSVFSDPEKTRQLVQDAGPWGPLVFIGMQIVQVFFAPIPGQVTGLAGGYLFGTWLGTLYTLIGATIGFTLIFLLVRKLGRPFVERFVDKKHLQKFDYIAKTNGAFVLFLVFLLPAFPDDLICFIAGLTNIRIRTLILISVAGRLPGYLVLSFSGAGVAQHNIKLVAILLSAVMVVSALAFWQRKRLERFVQHLAQKGQ
jgi:uncharacterized membrane protein YdjX (TVP38/TMEM64 family)